MTVPSPWRRFRRRVPYIPQMESAECGAAALAMVMAYYGYHAPLSEVRRSCRTSRDGASAQAICEAARKHGFEVEGVQADIAGVYSLPLPAILHWGFSHFVVLERVTRTRMTLVDPGRGRHNVSVGEFSQKFTGVAVVLMPGDGFVRRRQVRTSLRRYASLLRDAAPKLSQIFVASILLQCVVVVMPAANQFLVDRVIVPRNDQWLWVLGVALATTAVVRGLLTVVRGYALQDLQIRMDLSLMTGFARHLLGLPLMFFLQRRTGDLAQRLQDATIVRNVVANRAVAALLDMSQLATVGTLLFLYNPALSLVVVGLGGAKSLLLFGVRKFKRQMMTAEQASVGRESAALFETFSTLETTKASGTETYLFARWADRAAERVNNNLPRQHLDLALVHSMMLLQTLAFALVFWLGGRSVMAEEMTVGGFTAFLSLQVLFLSPLESFLEYADQLQYIGVQLARVDDVLATDREASGRVAPGRLSGSVELINVGMVYGENIPPPLSNISFRLDAGKKLVVVGRTGAGKSTLVGLLAGLHRPTYGTITFDCNDLKDLDLLALRKQAGVVLQNPFLLSGTIRANISFGRQDCSDAEIEDVARIVCLAEEIGAMPLGYDTEVGENGRALSGGQRQRVALARAIIHRPAILVLDEATRSIDREMELRIDANLASLGCTRIVASHRLAVAENADAIAVLDRGRLVQYGRYGELASAPGMFRDLVLATRRRDTLFVRT